MERIRAVIHHRLTDVVLYAVADDRGPLICRVLVGSSARDDLAASGACGSAPALRSIAAAVQSYLNGNRVDFSEVGLAQAPDTPFVAAVLSAARTVPYGQTCSYAELARRAGFPDAVRAAASVMRKNRTPLLIPCHRIIRKDGTAGAYNGDRSGGDAALKKKLLQMEHGPLKQRD